jgi:antitoxin ParD1/3/4
MADRANKPISVTLGPLAAKVEERVRSGDYASASEVVRAGLRALEREEALLDRLLPPIDESDPAFQARLKAAVEEALADPRPDIPIEEVERVMSEHRAEHRRRRGL